MKRTLIPSFERELSTETHLLKSPFSKIIITLSFGNLAFAIFKVLQLKDF